MKGSTRSLRALCAALMAVCALTLTMTAMPAAARGSSSLTLVPQISVLEPVPGQTHASAEVSGTGFHPNSAISIKVVVPARDLKFTYADVATTDGTGSFNYTFAVYMFAGLKVKVTAIDAYGTRASATFVVH